MTFGEAIEELKAGHAVRRAGWNGTGMCVFLMKDPYDPLQDSYFMLFTGDRYQPGWNPSTPDVLATDWSIAE